MHKQTTISIIAIILGILIIAFPMLGVIAASDILGLSVLLLAIFLLANGVSEVEYNTTRGLINTILGILMLIISLGLIFNPSIFAFLTALTIYLAGIFLIIIGLIIIVGNRDNKYGFWMGILGIVLGVIYIILGTYINNPLILGSLIGIWLLVTGVLNLLDNGY
ncbi:DUF308 domain-containing protein [Methanobrevibacter ruminantium]|uniref:DUF308 domain-containing protein n=1 Tax=Methanobrevibacter ruminantium TaxID=83816 RepID=UPI0025DC8B37|nr:DUF308 domain-containing protein [Methanobrevibacter ruminantium]MCI5738047.1 DUF308 domain-containing protein [Methanobrevibacter ruminantium]MDO5843159.1 DUF308 domain-containing protein [Methanobrevibacter ruminantium]